MTALITSLALLLSPTPLADHPTIEEGPWDKSASSVVASPTITGLSISLTEDQWLSATTPPDALPVTSPISEVLPELTLRERALQKLTELGAPPWVVNGFDCIGWRESKWSNVRSRTGDDGVLQINDVHDPELRRLGLDPYVPEDAAEFSWRLFTRAGNSFRDWTVRGLCGL